MKQLIVTIFSTLIFVSFGHSQIDSNYSKNIIELTDIKITTYLKKVLTVNNTHQNNPSSVNEPEIRLEEKIWSDYFVFNNWSKLFFENLYYPKEALKYSIQGEVTMFFSLDSDENVIDLYIIKPVPYLLEAVTKATEMIPNSTEVNIANVCQTYRLSIEFKISYE